MNEARAVIGQFSPGNALAECDAVIAEFATNVQRQAGKPVAIGLAGPQGSGKSTTVARLVSLLNENGCPAAFLSLDDFYLPRAHRIHLSQRIHPLLRTRGVPGTHDVTLALTCLSELCDPTADMPVPVPAFDKLADDRAPVRQWRSISRPQKIVFLEGWCVGVRPQADRELVRPINDLERKEDEDGSWRRFVNEQLKGEYRMLFDRLEATILFRAPSFDVIECWRAEQERNLAKAAGSGGAMTDSELRRFVAHFERLTRWMDIDQAADLIIDLDEGRLPIRHFRNDQ